MVSSRYQWLSTQGAKSPRSFRIFFDPDAPKGRKLPWDVGVPNGRVFDPFSGGVLRGFKTLTFRPSNPNKT
jgi:hypothetical protein